jgi:hypothetical protein
VPRVAKAALLAIHGMGEQRPGYSDELRLELQTRLGVRAGDLAFEEVFYQDLLQDNERRYWDRVRTDLRWHDLRKFMLFGLADVVALEAGKEHPRSAYTGVQARIAAALLRAWKAMNRTDGPVLFLAHSLGGHLLSNYLWDTQRAAAGHRPGCGIWKDLLRHAVDIAGAGNPLDPDAQAFLRRPGVHCIFTTGCTIPIYLASHTTIKPIDKPTAAFQWHNFYDRDDLLAWPLGQTCPEYAALVADHATNGGGSPVQWLLKSWNPLSYGSYWSDPDVLDPLCHVVKERLDGYAEPETPWPRALHAQRPLSVK